MAMVRWQPFQELEQARRQMDRLFDTMLPEGAHASPSTGRSGEAIWQPAVELQEADDSFILRAELPGVTADDLEVQASKDTVSIAGENRHHRQANDRGLYGSEFRYGRFERTLQLPGTILSDQVSAELRDGILTLTLPKAEPDRRKSIKVNVAGDRQLESRNQ